MSRPPASRTDRRPSSSSTPSPRRDAPSGCWATPPTARARFAPNWPTAGSRCWRRSPQARRRDRRLGKRDFSIDLVAGTVACPGGQTAAIRTEPSGQRRARFAKAGCDRCALRERCVQPARGSRAVLLAPDEELLQAARRALADPATAEHLRRTRPRIERLLGLLAVRYGARKSRYFGRRQSPPAGRLGRRTGQPQPDRPRPHRQLTTISAESPARPPPHTTAARPDGRPRQQDFFRSLLAPWAQRGVRPLGANTRREPRPLGERFPDVRPPDGPFAGVCGKRPVVPSGRADMVGRVLTPRLDVPPCASAPALALARDLGVSFAVAQVLMRRGLGDLADARAWLAGTDEHPASDFRDLDTAVALIARHAGGLAHHRPRRLRRRRRQLHGDSRLHAPLTRRRLRLADLPIGWPTATG